MNVSWSILLAEFIKEVNKYHGREVSDEDVKNPLVCGYLQMYKGEEAIKVKVVLDSHFLIGPDGAHMNVSGISGLAAKTSYSMFLLRAIQQKFRSDDNESVAFVFFNVKGRDLIPQTDLALSQAFRQDAFQQVELAKDQALQYLRCEVLQLPDAPKGFLTVTCEGLPLGFVKNLGNRANNLFPQAWRLRMNC